MTSGKAIRNGFRQFFHGHGHEVAPSASILTHHDPTLMFVNAGMVPFKDVFTGAEHRPYRRATSAQKCLRISGKHNDLENVGVTARHHTFFEMLGNFSFGDYFKEEAIVFAWEFLTRELGLDRSRLIVSVFGGEGELGPDSEAEQLWRKVADLPEQSIIRCGAKDNFWSMGDTGPCGPCSEIHYFFGAGEPDVGRFGDEPRVDGSGWVELWNLVFMQFERHADGRLSNLPSPCIDTGMGLERIACVTQGVLSNYDTDLLRPVVEHAAQLAGKPYGGSLEQDDVSMRVIADHARTTAFLIAEGLFPDRGEREYVLRRVMRRAIRHGHRLGIERPFLHECAMVVVDHMGEEYAELLERRALIADVTQKEEERFRATLRRGLDRLHAYEFAEDAQGVLPGSVAFELYDTYGFPLDLQEVIGQEQGFTVDTAGFERELAAARERSTGSKLGSAAVSGVYHGAAERLGPVDFVGYQADEVETEVAMLLDEHLRPVEQLSAGERGAIIAARTPFYGESGGQVGDRGVILTKAGQFRVTDTQKPVDGLWVHLGEVVEGSIAQQAPATLAVDANFRAAVRRNHSATHLLHLALRAVVGAQAVQKGSLVGPERFRFDYSGSRPLTPQELETIEAMVNERILRNVPVTTDVLAMDEAKRRGAIGIFEEKYGDVVRMLTIADSMELCGGVHVRQTGDIGLFKIVSESGIAAGVRRIEAVTGLSALQYVQRLTHELERAATLVKGGSLSVAEKVERLLAKQKELQREIDRLKKQWVSGGSGDLTAEARRVGDVRVLGAVVDVGEAAALRELADSLRDKLQPAVVALGTATGDGKAILICTVSKDLTSRYRAGDLVRQLAQKVGGGGGGRPDFAQAGGSDPSQLPAAVGSIYELVQADA